MDTSKLAQRLARIQDRNSGGSNIWFKSTDEKQKVRLVPYQHDDGSGPFIEVNFHYNIAGHRSLVCPNHTYGTPCPICELAEEFKALGSKDSYKIYKQYVAKQRTYSPVVVRGSEEDGVKLWGYGVTIYEELVEKFLDTDWGDLSDVKTGRDLTVWSIPKGGAGNDSDYIKPKMNVSPNQSVLLKKKADMVDIIKGIPNFLGDDNDKTFQVKTYDELAEIVRKLSDAEDDDYEETSYSASESTSTDDNDADLSSKLADLLGD